MENPASPDLSGAPAALGGTEYDIVRTHLGPAGAAAATEAAAPPPSDPEPWSGPSRESWEQLQGSLQALASLAEAYQRIAAGEAPGADDEYYDVDDDLGLERQFLHAARLAFRPPFTGAAVAVESPLPADLERALEIARSSAETVRIRR
jgi:hypothetical protein